MKCEEPLKREEPGEDQVGCVVGAVVQAQAGYAKAVRQQLDNSPGIDVFGEDEKERLVITMEGPSSRAVMQLTEDIQNFEGVLSLTPVYQHSEENQQSDETGGWKWR